MRKVLLIDDDAALREALEAVLVSHAHNVTSAQDGLAALRAAVETRPEVIVSNVNMPHREVRDAVRIFKTLPGFRHVPVVLMSGAELPVTGLTQIALRTSDFRTGSSARGKSCIGGYIYPESSTSSAAPDLRCGPGGIAALGIASLWPYSNAMWALRICEGIKLTHARTGGTDRRDGTR